MNAPPPISSRDWDAVEELIGRAISIQKDVTSATSTGDRDRNLDIDEVELSLAWLNKEVDDLLVSHQALRDASPISKLDLHDRHLRDLARTVQAVNEDWLHLIRATEKGTPLDRHDGPLDTKSTSIYNLRLDPYAWPNTSPDDPLAMKQQVEKLFVGRYQELRLQLGRTLGEHIRSQMQGKLDLLDRRQAEQRQEELEMRLMLLEQMRLAFAEQAAEQVEQVKRESAEALAAVEARWAGWLEQLIAWKGAKVAEGADEVAERDTAMSLGSLGEQHGLSAEAAEGAVADEPLSADAQPPSLEKDAADRSSLPGDTPLLLAASTPLPTSADISSDNTTPASSKLLRQSHSDASDSLSSRPVGGNRTAENLGRREGPNVEAQSPEKPGQKSGGDVVFVPSALDPAHHDPQPSPIPSSPSLPAVAESVSGALSPTPHAEALSTSDLLGPSSPQPKSTSHNASPFVGDNAKTESGASVASSAIPLGLMPPMDPAPVISLSPFTRSSAPLHPFEAPVVEAPSEVESGERL